MLAPTQERFSFSGTGSSNSTPLQASTTLQTSFPGLQSPFQSELRMSGASAPTVVDNSILNSSTSLVLNPIFLTDDTLGTAVNVGDLSSTRSYSGYVGSTDTVDYYRVNVNSGRLNVTLTGMSNDADVRVIRDANGNGVVDAGEIIASSTRGGALDEAINLAGLTSGNYFIQVSQYAGNTNYSLRLSSDNPSNLLATETDIGALSGTRVFSNTINNNNTSDIYRFSVSNITLPLIGTIPTGVNITLSGLSSDADVRLIRDVNGNGIVDGTDVVAGSAHGSTNAEWISSALATGSYFVQVYQFSGSTNYNLSVSTGDWYSSNLSDAGIIGQARALGQDGTFSRNDMISILREAKDYGSIDAAEVTDLRRLLSDRGSMMPDYVRNLTNKIVNSDPANPRSGIGNLFAGSSDTQMERLIGKWFFGNDRPDATGTYRYTSGSLFQGGISYTDVDQGAVGDCYFMASLGATALRSPSTISNMFIDNGDGTFTVRMYNSGVADYVTVDRYLPFDSSGNFIYANNSSGRTYSDTNNELWVALAEKAYAQFNESGWIGQDNTNSYDGIEGGWPYNAMRQITNRSTDHRDMSTDILFLHFDDVNTMISAFNAGRMIAMNTYDSTSSGIVGNHSYVLVGYSSSADQFQVYNPWGGSGSTRWITRQQLLDNFDSWDSTTT